MVYGLVKGSKLALLLTVAQARLWVPTLVDGLSIDTAAEAMRQNHAKLGEIMQDHAKLGKIGGSNAKLIRQS